MQPTTLLNGPLLPGFLHKHALPLFHFGIVLHPLQRSGEQPATFRPAAGAAAGSVQGTAPAAASGPLFDPGFLQTSATAFFHRV